jgi:hypothetical protein
VGNPSKPLIRNCNNPPIRPAQQDSISPNLNLSIIKAEESIWIIRSVADRASKCDEKGRLFNDCENLAYVVTINYQWKSKCESAMSARVFIGVSNGRGNGDMVINGPRIN